MIRLEHPHIRLHPLQSRRANAAQPRRKHPYVSRSHVTSAIRRLDKLMRCMHPEDVKALRHAIGGSQQAFAKRFGLSPRTLAQWESGRRWPDLTATALLKTIACAPQVVEAALKAFPDFISTLGAEPNLPETEGWPVGEG